LLPERDWLTLIEAAWLLQIREHTARQMVTDEAHPERPLKPYRGGGGRTKVTTESVDQLLKSTRSKTRLAQLKKHEITAPKPPSRSGLPEPLTAAISTLSVDR
jgi:hypothetical protein